MMYLNKTCSRKSIPILLFLLCFGHNGFSQNEASLKIRVVDNKTNNGIPFATLILKNINRGGIANASGDFQIPFKYKILNDTLKISCIGYKTKNIGLEKLKDDVINIIPLEIAINKISEVSIKAKKMRVKAKKIVEMAINNIETNYYQSPFSYEAYYRDYQLKRNEYINLNEASIKVFDKGFKTYDGHWTKMQLYNYRKNKDFNRNDETISAYDNSSRKFVPNAYMNPHGGNELAILRIHNPIRNYKDTSFSFVYRLQKDFLKNHKFKFKKPVFIDSVLLYNIQFKAKNGVTVHGLQEYSAKGKIYIESGNFAIHKLEYSLYTKVEYEKKLILHVVVEYSRQDRVMHLNYISTNNLFKIENPNDFKAEFVKFDKKQTLLSFKLNRKPFGNSISDINNYSVKYGFLKMKILEVKYNENDTTVNITLKHDVGYNFNYPQNHLAESFYVDFKNIEDIYGRPLGETTFVEVNQFRELFVHKKNSAGRKGWSNPSFINISIPLYNNPVLSNEESPDFWMNTPLKQKLDQVN